MQLEFEESEQKTGSGSEAIKNTIEHVELTEEDRQSITSKSSAYPTANISNFFDGLTEEEDSEEWSTLRPDLTSISSTQFRKNGATKLRKNEESSNIDMNIVTHIFQHKNI